MEQTTESRKETHLLLDARNCIYRAIYAVAAERHKKIRSHYFVALLRQLVRYMQVIKPSHVHVFWDAPRDTVWRRRVLATYKDRSKSDYVADISADLAMTSEVAKECFKMLNIRQYEMDRMEADDLIYAATAVLHPRESVIVSSDSDMTQIPYTFSSSKVYDPQDHKFVERPTLNPVLMKAIVGDTSDSIKGYYGIGPKKGKIIVESMAELRSFLDLQGRDPFKRNMALIDLSLCPWLPQNKFYVLDTLTSPVNFDDAGMQKASHKLMGLLTEYSQLIPPFKRLF